jgi:aspartyl-tRNA(Asn)/glutamyl-tRNA(Gln) amidotransferase subunit C
MAELTRADVEHLASLARIDLSAQVLDRILSSVATVQEAPTEGVEAMSHPMPLVNVTRPDEVRRSLTPDEALSGAPESDAQRFSVPRILDVD